MMANNNGAAVPTTTFGPYSDELVLGFSYKCGVHTLTIRKIERHYGNLQVCYFDDFEQKLIWEHIGIFHRMLAKQQMSV